MDIIGQLDAALKLGSKAAATISIACAIVLLSYHFFPTQFNGLPQWVIPSVRVLGIFFGTVFAVAIALAATKFTVSMTRRAYNHVAAPWRFRNLKNSIKNAPISVKYVFVYALSRQCRVVDMPEDHAVTLLMKDKGYIVYIWQGRFQITENTWRALLKIANPIAHGTVFPTPFSMQMHSETMEALVRDIL